MVGNFSEFYKFFIFNFFGMISQRLACQFVVKMHEPQCLEFLNIKQLRANHSLTQGSNYLATAGKYVYSPISE